jgi:hypothetical protein
MPATSQQQQKLFGLALSVKRGETPRSEASDEVLNIVDTMSEKDIEDFASTSHSGLPKKVESIIRGLVRETYREKVLGEVSYDSAGNLKIKKQYDSISDYEKVAKKGDHIWFGPNPNDFKGIGKNLLSKVLGKDSEGNVIATPFGKNKKFTIPQKNQKVIVVESINEAPTRRSKDFFEDDNKYGIDLYKLMRGKWDRNKALQYFIKLQSKVNNNSKYQNILYFIATGLGINGRSYTSVVDLRDDIITAVENLYKLHNESVNEEQEQLDEKLITFSNRAPYGQVVFIAGGAGCFSESTPIKTENGYKSISEIKKGDMVYSYNEETNEQELKPVLEVYSYKLNELPGNQKMLELKFDNGVEIHCTENHEFYIDSKWVMAKDIELGNSIGSGLKLISKKIINFDNTVYDFQVEGNHNYYVSEGDVLVHNSGKGFAIENFIDSAGYKVRDVDEMKKQIQKLNAIGKLSIQQIIDKFGRNIAPKDMEIIKKIQDDGYDLKTMNLKIPNHVYALHILVDAMGIKDKTLENMLAAKSNPETLPNIIFDITAKKITSITEVLPMLHSVGYKPNNIHLVWILTDYNIAIKQNAERSRVVPADIMLGTHIGAGNTVWGMVTSALPKGMNGRVDVILNNQQNTVFFIQRTTDKKTGQKKAVVSGFLSLPVKKQGGPILPEKVWKDTLYNWIKDNGPKELTANF